MTRRRPPWKGALLALACLAAGIAVLSGAVRYTSADPQGTLLVGQQVLTRGTVTLDSLGPAWTEGNYRVIEIDGAHYYYFPPGTVITTIPIVAAALAAGLDIAQQEAALQILISSLFASLTVLLLFAVARLFLGFGMSVLLALGFWAATPLASTNGTALWSHGPAVIYALAALLAALYATERSKGWCWWPLGLALFMAILSRPTMTVVAVALLAYVVARDKRTAVRAAALLLILLLAFAAGSYLLTGQAIPPYYQPSRLAEGDVLTGLLGTIASPSRGLLVYLAWIPVLVITAWLTRRQWTGQRLLVGVNATTVVALVLAVSTFALWYGGAGYGPRLLTDALPSLFAVLVVTWPRAWSGTQVPLAVAWALVATMSVGQHTVAGLFNPATGRWNSAGTHDISTFVNDWRFPQFLHTEARQRERQALYDSDPPSGVGYRDVP